MADDLRAERCGFCMVLGNSCAARMPMKRLGLLLLKRRPDLTTQQLLDILTNYGESDAEVGRPTCWGLDGLPLDLSQYHRPLRPMQYRGSQRDMIAKLVVLWEGGLTGDGRLLLLPCGVSAAAVPPCDERPGLGPDGPRAQDRGGRAQTDSRAPHGKRESKLD